MTTPVTGTQNLSQIMADIDLGPAGGIQMMFAKLQMAQSQICKSQANDYMKQIQDIQAEQKACADMIEAARTQMNAAKTGKNATAMSPAMKTFFDERGLSYDKTGGDNAHTEKEWEYNLKSLTNYQEQIGSKTQTLMVYLQDFIGQYNSFLQGANTAISNANQVLTNIARGQ
ncbi:MAG: hypothetical protein EOL86_07810 [Deltaproteobacteria bacterium]|nr:hypothetical protein [Deltaproteobacteria bacterium]